MAVDSNNKNSTADDTTDDDAPTNWLPYICITLIMALLVTFVGMMGYAIVASNQVQQYSPPQPATAASTDALLQEGVKDACPYLWEMVLTRFVAGFIVFFILMGIMCVECMRPTTVEVIIVIWAFLVIYFATFAGVGGIVTGRATVSNSGCISVLKDATSTNTPLLGVMSWICVGVDAIYALIFAMLGCTTAYQELWPREV